nr:MAG TPA: hypothetical protein [Caudoviricetes sp.]
MQGLQGNVFFSFKLRDALLESPYLFMQMSYHSVLLINLCLQMCNQVA